MFIATILSAVIGMLILVATFATARGAPQEAAGAALAMCFAIIPYVIARSLQIPAERRTAAQRHRELMDEMRKRPPTA